ncbi:MAG: phage head closure protein [Peptostreptococcus sp.]|jgi:SPP1 family predicted phage head-tail adaptor|uniref:Putative phage head-tail adaptor n=1 Tax=Peptostreptococcus anaerobius 653-L TaxID=596329 RepID=D3MU71_9FIRM|nr:MULTISPECIES: phage head closure protein [Peptostreptococcus]EFD04330.1 putative phage head-tail adaptor [Peptostreptococcus anaerobius 653-L]MDU1264537.1 phage head closure protein [Peptostreptococcus sp.]
MVIGIGKLDRRIEIIWKKIVSGKGVLNDLGEYEVEENELGEFEQGQSKSIKLWAEVTTMRGSEKLTATGIITGDEYLKIVIRYRSDIDRKCLVRYQNSEYEITSVSELGRREYLEIICNRETKD